MIRLVPHHRVLGARIEGPDTRPPDRVDLLVKYDPTAIERASEAFTEYQRMGVRPRAFLCGFVAYVSLFAFVVTTGSLERPENVVLYLGDREKDPELYGIPVLYNASLGMDRDVFIAGGVGRAAEEALSRGEKKP